ncbi:hypothetical protein H5410_036284 [Solanum commersonii]|uniref:Uncharacterized protein n=1 Tax=Solanum commersonii TaxID=4109 RepID=A0A9J5Y721_SOLCO|nr:hypothetical protein H5410_036284 [Solanum commersonii]
MASFVIQGNNETRNIGNKAPEAPTTALQAEDKMKKSFKDGDKN